MPTGQICLNLHCVVEEDWIKGKQSYIFSPLDCAKSCIPGTRKFCPEESGSNSQRQEQGDEERRGATPSQHAGLAGQSGGRTSKMSSRQSTKLLNRQRFYVIKLFTAEH